MMDGGAFERGRAAVAARSRGMSWAVWITGLPGSGKSAIARAAAASSPRHGEPVACSSSTRCAAR